MLFNSQPKFPTSQNNKISKASRVAAAMFAGIIANADLEVNQAHAQGMSQYGETGESSRSTKSTKQKTREVALPIYETGLDGRKYRVPAKGVFINYNEANFSVFPEQLNFEPGEYLILVNRYWQTAALYDRDGKLFKVQFDDGSVKDLKFQAGTGSSENPTETRVYQMQIRDVVISDPESYTSSKFNNAPMPYAMHIAEVLYILPNGTVKLKTEDGKAVHVRPSTAKETGASGFASHGCVGVNFSTGKFLFQLGTGQFDGGDKQHPFVVVFNKSLPKTKSLGELVEVLKGDGNSE